MVAVCIVIAIARRRWRRNALIVAVTAIVMFLITDMLIGMAVDRTVASMRDQGWSIKSETSEGRFRGFRQLNDVEISSAEYSFEAATMTLAPCGILGACLTIDDAQLRRHNEPIVVGNVALRAHPSILEGLRIEAHADPVALLPAVGKLFERADFPQSFQLGKTALVLRSAGQSVSLEVVSDKDADLLVSGKVVVGRNNAGGEIELRPSPSQLKETPLLSANAVIGEKGAWPRILRWNAKTGRLEMSDHD
ncbi:MAG: hypothetical protein R3A47_12175 [Polyangiales bacterium]